LRVLVVANLYPGSRQPAFGTFVAAHVEALRRAGAEVAVVAIRDVPVHRAVARKYVSLALRSAMHALRARVRGRRPAIVEAHVAYPTSLMAWIAARLAGARLVIYCHGTDVTGRSGGSRIHRIVFGWLLARADLVVANSEFLRDLVAAEYGVPPDRLTVIPPGVDLNLFAAGVGERRPNEILFVGRLSRQKGVLELLEAVRDLGNGDVSLRFIGDGPLRATLEHDASAAGIRAVFEGPRAPAEVASLMGSAAVVAMPSILPEGLGLAALEAMASGALVVATAAGGIVESVIDGETGWLVPPNDVPALSAALRDALATAGAADGSRRMGIQERGLAKAREHDIDRAARRTLDAYASFGPR
jgi:glycosyltransferase involved in cell wall biosynthesis